VARLLDRSLQLVTVPYEIRADRTPEGRSFLVLGNDRAVLPQAVAPDEFRRKLIDLLTLAKSRHPIADYLR